MTDRLRLDLHVHTRYSPDSRLSLEEIAMQLSYTGLKGFAVTDHNSITAHRELPGIRERFPGYLLLPGVEVSTNEGHLLVYGVSELPPVRAPLGETLEWVARANGVAVLAHPFRWSHGVGRKIVRSAPVAAIESVNGHTSLVSNAKAELVAAERHLGSTGGSDVHELADVGRAFTEFAPEIDSTDGLLDALRRGNTNGDGVSLRWPGRLRWAVRNGALRIARGFRSV